MIQKFYTKAEWDAATKSTTESTIAYVEDTKECLVNGVNVITDSPTVGDILCVNSDGAKLWIMCDTYQAASLPAGYEAKAVVAGRHGRELLIACKDRPAAKWLEVYPYIVNGYTLDGASHTVRFRLAGKPSASTWYEMSYSATTDDEFLAALQNMLTANSITDWSAYKNAAGEIILQRNNYASYENLAPATTYYSGDISLTAQVERDFTGVAGSFVSNQISEYNTRLQGALWNYERASNHFRADISSSAYNPTSDVSGPTAYPICLPAYLGQSEYRKDSEGNYVDHCAGVRAIFGEGEEGWLKYMKAIRYKKRDSMYGGGMCRNLTELTQKMSAKTYTDTEGAEQPLYPAFKACADIDLGTDGLEAGDFFLPSLNVILDSPLSSTPYGNGAGGKADPMNRSLIAIGGTTRAGDNTFWTCAAINRATAWIASSKGIVDGTNACNSPGVAPFALYTLPTE